MCGKLSHHCCGRVDATGQRTGGVHTNALAAQYPRSLQSSSPLSSPSAPARAQNARGGYSIALMPPHTPQDSGRCTRACYRVGSPTRAPAKSAPYPVAPSPRARSKRAWGMPHPFHAPTGAIVQRAGTHAPANALAASPALPPNQRPTQWSPGPPRTLKTWVGMSHPFHVPTDAIVSAHP